MEKRLEAINARLLAALAAIGNMHIGEDADFQQISALQSAIALTTIKEIEAES